MNADINTRFEVVSYAVSELLERHRGLPAPQGIALDRRSSLDAEVQLHMGRLDHLAVWAKSFGVPIRVTDRDTHVRVTAAVHLVHIDAQLEVWGHMAHGDAWRMLAAHNHTLTRDGVDLDPDAILNAFANAAAGGGF